MDSLSPFLQGLAPLQHAGLSRRTTYYRAVFNYSLIKTSKYSSAMDGRGTDILDLSGGHLIVKRPFRSCF